MSLRVSTLQIWPYCYHLFVLDIGQHLKIIYHKIIYFIKNLLFNSLNNGTYLVSLFATKLASWSLSLLFRSHIQEKYWEVKHMTKWKKKCIKKWIWGSSIHSIYYQSYPWKKITGLKKNLIIPVFSCQNNVSRYKKKIEMEAKTQRKLSSPMFFLLYKWPQLYMCKVADTAITFMLWG